MPDTRFATFAIAIPLYRQFDYALEPQDKAIIGGRYRLPFSGGVKTGVLLSVSNTSEFDPKRIKPVREALDQNAVVSEHMLALAHWMANYYQQPFGEVLFQCLPNYLRGKNPDQSSRVKVWRLLEVDDEAMSTLQSRSPRQHELAAALAAAKNGLNAIELKQVNSDWHQPLKALQGKGLVSWDWADQSAAMETDTERPQLIEDQQRAFDQIQSGADKFAVHLIDGITGSGKTEVFLRLIESQLQADKQVIYLVPEIGLTNQLIDRVRQRFGECFVTSHSALTDLQRYQAWDRFRRGQAAIMLGTRSSLFAQSERLGLIIIDEEHDHSYRQQDGIRYHARDVAIKRAQMLDIPCVLGSATPSLESLANCEREHYQLHRLDQRPTRYPPPVLKLIDVRNSKLDYGCSQQTLKRIEHHIDQQGQVLVYLNRRGFAPVLMCHECGWQSLCRNCDSRLTLHQSVGRLLCHHCGYGHVVPSACPECDHADIKHYGIGTEQLEQGLLGHFPETSIFRIDRDTISSRDALKERLQQLKSGEPCIMIGTQMIAKGHDYPSITLTVILDADQALFSASYRASERLVQTVFQVSGRAGRGDRKGEALLQTRFSEHALMQSLITRSYREIAAEILSERRLLGFPPFGRVVVFRADGMQLKEALAQLEAIKSILQQSSRLAEVTCVGPIPALMTRRIGRYRAQLCLLGSNYQILRSLLAEAMPTIQQLPKSNKVNWTIDVDAFDL